MMHPRKLGLGLGLIIFLSASSNKAVYCFTVSTLSTTPITREKATRNTRIDRIHKYINTQRPTPFFNTAASTTVTNTFTQLNINKNGQIEERKGGETLFSDVYILTNDFVKQLMIKPIREYVELKPSGSAGKGPLAKLTAPPESPGISRPVDIIFVWNVVLGELSFILIWYVYYLFCIEEEIFEHEQQQSILESTTGFSRVSWFGGYGTLFVLVYGLLVGGPIVYFDLPGADTLLGGAVVWLLIGQMNLYRRVNLLCEDKMDELMLIEPPLHPWWALVPAFNVIVGLRQIHFLSEYWRVVKGEEYRKDVIAEELFPFICSERFTIDEFFRTPSLWFWFSKNFTILR